MATASLAGHRVTSARAQIPAWGCWYAEASIDGEASLSGQVDLVIADLTLRGTILSGGPAKGRSHFRIVGGAGGWGKTLKKWRGYRGNDAGIKLSTVLGDVAKEVGETIDLGTRANDRLGYAWAREEGQARQTLELVAPKAWYVDEAGVTKLGARPSSTYTGKATRGPVDLASGTVTLAAESIATILPGVTVDGLVAADVEHEVTPEGLRSTIWGARSAPTGMLATWSRLFESLDPARKYRCVYEYRVGLRSGNRLDLQPVRVSTGMPDLGRVPVRPGVAGCNAEIPLGARVLVGFVDGSPARPVVLGFPDPDDEQFAPESLDIKAGGMAGGEHLMTTEACSLLIYNTLVALMAAAGGGPLVAAVLQPLLGSAIVTALTAQAVPVGTGLTGAALEAAQEIASAAQLAGFATGVVPATTCQFFEAAIAANAAKAPNATGHFPGTGCKTVTSG